MRPQSRLAGRTRLGLLLLALAAAGTVDCGRGTLHVRDAAPNTGGRARSSTTGDAAADGDASDTPNTSATGPLETFCTGEPKVGRETAITTAQLTAYRMGMAACCAARYGVLFHTQESLGGDGQVMILQTDPTLAEGEHTLGDSWSPVAVELRFSDDPPDTWRLGMGSLRITGDPAGPVPFTLGLCVQVASSEVRETLTMFYVPDISIAPASWNNRFGIYLLEDPEMSATEAASLPLNDLVLASHPLLDLSGIASVTRETSEIRVQDIGDFGDTIRNEMTLRKHLLMPFVVESDGVRIYLGEFVSPLSSSIGPGPYVASDAIGADRFRIEPDFDGKDPRWDPRIVHVLTEASRLVE